MTTKKEFLIVGVIAVVLVFGFKYVASNSIKVGFNEDYAAQTDEDYCHNTFQVRSSRCINNSNGKCDWINGACHAKGQGESQYDLNDISAYHGVFESGFLTGTDYGFTIRATVRNTGSVPWTPEYVDFQSFDCSNRMRYVLPSKTINPGERYTFNISLECYSFPSEAMAQLTTRELRGPNHQPNVFLKFDVTR